MSFNLQDELTNINDASRNALDLLDVSSASAEEVNTLLNDVVDRLAGDIAAIRDATVMDPLRCLLAQYEDLPGDIVGKLFDCIVSGLSTEVAATIADDDPTNHSDYRSHREILEIYSFLLKWFVTLAQKKAIKDTESAEVTDKGRRRKPAKKSKGAFDWEENVTDALGTMSKALKLKTDRIWQTSPERDLYISNCFLKPANLVAESPTYMKNNSIKSAYFKVICVATKYHGQVFNTQMTIMQNLQYTEHLSESMAELVAVFAREYDYSQLGEDILKEIGSRSFNAKDTKGPRSFSRFMIRLAELAPRVVLKQIIALRSLQDSESYPMRIAILEIVGSLIHELSLSDGLDIDDETRAKQVEAFFNLLFERFLDNNSFVRSKVVTILLKTCDLPVIYPKIRFALTELTIRSLEDKSSNVRKNCIALLTKLITTHPYGAMHGGGLSLKEWEARMAVLEKELQVVGLPLTEEDAAIAAAKEFMGDDSEDEHDGEEDGSSPKEEEEENDSQGKTRDEDENSDSDDKVNSPPKKRKGPRKSGAVAAEETEETLGHYDQDTLNRLRLTQQYYSDALGFIRLVEGASETVETLLASTTTGEVLEAIEFFKTAHIFELECGERGVKRMIHLIWSKDQATTEEDGREVKGIRSKLIECYNQLYFQRIPDASPADEVVRVTRNLVGLTKDASLAELISLEALLCEMMVRGVVSDEVVAMLWQMYGATRISRQQRQGAIIVLGMLAVPRPDVVADEVDTLLRVGLGAVGKADLVVAKYTCIALGRLAGSTKKVKGSLADERSRIPMDSPIFAHLRDILEQPCRSKDWFSMAEHAINTIYTLGDQPDALCSAILRRMTHTVFGHKASASPASSPTKTVRSGGAGSSVGRESVGPGGPRSRGDETMRFEDATQIISESKDLGNVFELSQLIFVAGHCAIKQLIHLEIVERELKRRKAEDDKARTGGKAAVQEELDQVAGSLEDDIGDAVVHIKEKELMYSPDALLSVFGPMSAAIVAQPKAYKHPLLKTAATLSLSKFMCVCTKFCEDHLMLMFRLLESSEEPTVRSNIVIALGDVAVCFSTIMDENSTRLYAMLHDRDVTVKKNTLMVLTHLILNGMIKVKGQLGEMAKCLQDSDRRISDLGHLFFTELASKEKAIYNNLPDIISNLSSGTAPVSEEVFAQSMRFIMSFIDKKREAESIVEKLCQRFQMTTEPRQWRDIAFCLSLLPFNSEVAVKKLVEGLPFYQDKLHEETVFKRFQEILTKAQSNKVVKNEADLREFEAALEGHRAKGSEDHELERRVQQQTKKRNTRAPRTARSRRVEVEA